MERDASTERPSERYEPGRVASNGPGGRAPNCVLVIDEINRANLAKTLGELITLLEPSKRLGQWDEQETELPCSGERFAVPPNLFVVGTMNTADRSIALMDTALRRRFSFREVVPRPELLSDDLDGINLQALLNAMNARIEALFDRDHVLGHSYPIDVATSEELIRRFESQIIPLLQEYFFDDWRRIQQVFGDAEQPPEHQVIQQLDRADDGALAHDRKPRFQVNPALTPAAIKKIYTSTSSSAPSARETSTWRSSRRSTASTARTRSGGASSRCWRRPGTSRCATRRRPASTRAPSRSSASSPGSTDGGSSRR